MEEEMMVVKENPLIRLARMSFNHFIHSFTQFFRYTNLLFLFVLAERLLWFAFFFSQFSIKFNEHMGIFIIGAN